MTKKYDIETVKTERRGILRQEKRVTSRDTEGNIGVSDYQKNESDATRQSRERVGEQAQKARK